jgi:superfamily II DNA or RNA helicase/DNA-binding transcriptional regulator YiaG
MLYINYIYKILYISFQGSVHTMSNTRPTATFASEAAEFIRALRKGHGLTQVALAERIGVSFATVNRWENGQTTPSALALVKIHALADSICAVQATDTSGDVSQPENVALDFTARPDAVKAIVEAERLTFAHTVNPAFATETSRIDPLPHQRIAVYDVMLKQPRLRFLLADDAGAGKTIMSGLVIREMLARRSIRRALIVPPAGLVGNWQRELKELFQLESMIAGGQDMAKGNPFAGDNSDLAIVSIDTLRGGRAKTLLASPDTRPYDLVIFDEAHKLSCDQGSDLRVTKSDRYKLAEMLAGAATGQRAWVLPWQVKHLLLLTATPHMGKDYPFFALWRLLDPQCFSTWQAFEAIPPEIRSRHFLRRTKEEMVHLDGTPLYPMRVSDTLGYSLTTGKDSEQTLYDATTDYLLYIYNQAQILNRSAARLALSVFQRRLSSSTFALLRSFERRVEKLSDLIARVEEGKITETQLATWQSHHRDIFDEETADEEVNDGSGLEKNEKAENEILGNVVAVSLAELHAECEQVRALVALAKRVLAKGVESKFERLREVIEDERFSGEKILIFTEHRDTLEYLSNRLSALGFTGRLAHIHGGMDYRERQEAIEHFRRPATEHGAQYMICTDAAAEGVNLQFCWIMINYDIPWNPARLEQRMGRIHRYGQKHDPVFLLNLAATSTREGKVLKTLLDKLERIRKQLSSDKVFDSIGRVFSDISIKTYMERALTAARNNTLTDLTEELDGKITAEQLQAALDKDRHIFGQGGDVASKLPTLRDSLYNEEYRSLLPGFVQGFANLAAPLLHVRLSGDDARSFTLDVADSPYASLLWEALDAAMGDKGSVPASRVDTGRLPALSFSRPSDENVLWMHPGEPIFDAFCRSLRNACAEEALRGGIFLDANAQRPYLLHVAKYAILHGEQTAWHLAAVRQDSAELSLCPLEYFLCIHSREGGNSSRALSDNAQRLALAGTGDRERVRAFLLEESRKQALREADAVRAELPQRKRYLKKGYEFQEIELTSRRAALKRKERGGAKVQRDLEAVIARIHSLHAERDAALERLVAEPHDILPGSVNFIAHALVLPEENRSLDDPWRMDNIDALAMNVVRVFESGFGEVHPVHTPELARVQELQDYPGFDLLSFRRPPGYSRGEKPERRCIEVKGTRGDEQVVMSENEWDRAMNLRSEYWLYVVADCASPAPRLIRIQDPAWKLLVKQNTQTRATRRIKLADILPLAEGE